MFERSTDIYMIFLSIYFMLININYLYRTQIYNGLLFIITKVTYIEHRIILTHYLHYFNVITHLMPY
jgi:uncharacterized membrane protein YesL